MKQQVLAYAKKIGYPNAQLYGNDSGVLFGSDYEGAVTPLAAQLMILGYAQMNFPNAALNAPPPDATQLLFND